MFKFIHSNFKLHVAKNINVYIYVTKNHSSAISTILKYFEVYNSLEISIFVICLLMWLNFMCDTASWCLTGDQRRVEVRWRNRTLLCASYCERVSTRRRALQAPWSNCLVSYCLTLNKPYKAETNINNNHTLFQTLTFYYLWIKF